MTKLDESRVIRIIREKRKGTPNGKIAEEAGVSVRWGIESAYAQIEVMRAKPRSCNRGGGASSASSAR